MYAPTSKTIRILVSTQLPFGNDPYLHHAYVYLPFNLGDNTHTSAAIILVDIRRTVGVGYRQRAGMESRSECIERIIFSERGIRPLYIHEHGYTHISKSYSLYAFLKSSPSCGVNSYKLC